MIQFLLRWIQSLPITPFVIFNSQAKKKKKFLQELPHMDAAGPGESLMLVKDPHDQTDQKQVSNVYYKTTYKSLFPPLHAMCNKCS